MDLLVYFASRPTQVVSKQDLLNEVWQTEAISESALTRSITELRQALDDSAQNPRIIETIAKRGYRLIAPVCEAATKATASRSVPAAAANASSRRLWAWTTAVGIAAVGMTLGVWLPPRGHARPLAPPAESSWGDHATTRSGRALQDYILAARLMRDDGARGLDAKPHLLKALREDPEFASAHLLLAYALQCTGAAPAEYLPPARKALALSSQVSDPERHFIAASMSWLLAQAATDEEARHQYLVASIPEFEETLRLQPNHLWANWLLSDAYRATNRRADSARSFAHLAELRPDSFPLQVQAAGVTLDALGAVAARPAFQRAAQLLDAGADEGRPDLRQFVEFFEVHQAWLRGRAKDAARIADAYTERHGAQYDDYCWTRLGQVRLTLGQLRMAEQAFSHIQGSDPRAIAFASLALARGDSESVLSHVTSCPPTDLAVISFAVRAGDVHRASQLLAAMHAPPLHLRWAEEEIREASGDAAVVKRALALGAPWTRVMSGVRAFLYSETLALAAVRVGEIDRAIHVLREAEPVGESTLTSSGHSGYFWLRTQLLMADLYRRQGKLSEAGAIEDRLRQMLATADDDFPIRTALEDR